MKVRTTQKTNGEVKLPKELELFACPNPECRKNIKELIVLSDTSTTPVERYYACPHCFIKLDVTSVQLLKEEEKKRKEESPIKPPEKEKGSSRCTSYLGYLASLPENAPIPRECLACPKVLDCAMENK